MTLGAPPCAGRQQHGGPHRCQMTTLTSPRNRAEPSPTTSHTHTADPPTRSSPLNYRGPLPAPQAPFSPQPPRAEARGSNRKCGSKRARDTTEVRGQEGGRTRQDSRRMRGEGGLGASPETRRGWGGTCPGGWGGVPRQPGLFLWLQLQSCNMFR